MNLAGLNYYTHFVYAKILEFHEKSVLAGTLGLGVGVMLPIKIGLTWLRGWSFFSFACHRKMRQKSMLSYYFRKSCLGTEWWLR